jgi:hypothetical protein
MTRFEFSAGPSVALFELDSDQVIQLVECAVSDAGLAPVGRECEGNDGVGGDGLFHFQARARRRYVSQNCPFAAQTSGFRFPLNLYKISAEIPVFLSFSLHDSMYRQIKWMVYSYPAMMRMQLGGASRITNYELRVTNDELPEVQQFAAFTRFQFVFRHSSFVIV